MRYILIICFCACLPSVASAASSLGFGQIADNLMEPISILAGFIGSASIIVGVTSIFAAIIKYSQYRINPLVAPMSTIILLIVIGVLLICLPLTYKLTESGIPYHFHL